MTQSSIFPFLLPSFIVTNTTIDKSEMHLSVQSISASAECPQCGFTSSSVHSHYTRQIQDTPLGLLIVWLRVNIRRFRCSNANCRATTFAEQPSTLFERRKRRTNRLLVCATQIGVSLGGNAGARLAGKLAMQTSASTILRLLHQLACPEINAPRVIGIDDWAFRKGATYGTIIVDHETGKPIDLLPARDRKTVEQWLEQHPSIEVVTRDRSGEYRKAITQALPMAIQIADRWHLLKNLRDAIQRHIVRKYVSIHGQMKGYIYGTSYFGG